MRYLLIALLLFASSSALAQPYAFIGAAGIDGNGTAGFGAGYNITPNIGLEASYWKPSSLKEDTAVVPSGANTASVNRTVEGSILSLSAIGAWPVGNWQLLGKVSAHRLDVDFRERTVVVSNAGAPVQDAVVNRSNTDWVMGVGVGVGYTLSREVSARLFLERIGKSEELERLDQVLFQAIYTF